MRALPLILLSALSLLATGAAQQPPSAEDSGFVLGVNTYFDVGPPFDYYEIFIVTAAKTGSKVERFTLTPQANKCWAPEKTEYAENKTPLSVKELPAGEDPCKISDKAVKKEQKRKAKEGNFSGAHIALQIACGGTTRTIQTRILERDWFLAHPGTPQNTSWTMKLLSKLRDLTGPSVMEKPMFTMPERGSAAPLSADPATVEYLRSGKYDSLFPGADHKASEIYAASLILPPQPTVKLLSSTPVEPIHFTLPGYPPLARVTSQEAEPSVVLRVDAEGNVASIDLYSGQRFFEGIVRDAVRDWKFPAAPPTADVVDPPREVTVKFSFRLNCKADEQKR